LEYRISSYALTVEPKTALNKLIQTGKIAAPKDEVAEHFAILVETLEANDFIHYELSILAKKTISPRIIRRIGWEKYLGIGPLQL
jgi:oxygen-independent coproporphyrinogen-3 oxidase